MISAINANLFLHKYELVMQEVGNMIIKKATNGSSYLRLTEQDITVDLDNIPIGLEEIRRYCRRSGYRTSIVESDEEKYLIISWGVAC